jgi:hypothetical protein
MLLMGFNARADAPRVVLLVSVNDPYPEAEDRQSHGPLHDQIGRAFAEHFHGKFGALEHRILYSADQSDLWRELQDPANVALFWLSHAGSAPPNLLGARPSVIVDAHGIEVAPLFASVQMGSNLRYLGVIGCYTKEYFNRLQGDPTWQAKNGFVHLDSFDGQVSLFDGLRQAFNSADMILNGTLAAGAPLVSPHLPESQASRPSLRKLTVVRRISSDASTSSTPASARLEWNGNILGIFPPAGDGEIQTLTVWIPVSRSDDLHKLILILTSGAFETNGHPPPTLGELDVQLEGESMRWTRVELNGKPLGVHMNIYKPQIGR